MPRKVLGIEPLEAGYRSVLAWPRAGSLAWTRGKVPTVKRPISVDWHRNADGFQLTLEIPAEITAQACLPTEWGDQATVDGHPAITQRWNGTVRVQVVGQGKHEISVGR